MKTKNIFLISFFSLSPFFANANVNANSLDGAWKLYDVLCFDAPEGHLCKSNIETKTLTVSEEPLRLCTETTFTDGQKPQSGCLEPYHKGSRDEFEKLELQLSENGESLYVTHTSQFEKRRTVRSRSYALGRQQKEYMRIYEKIRYYSYSSEFKQWRESFKPWRKEYYFRR